MNENHPSPIYGEMSPAYPCACDFKPGIVNCVARAAILNSQGLILVGQLDGPSFVWTCPESRKYRGCSKESDHEATATEAAQRMCGLRRGRHITFVASMTMMAT